MYFENHARIGYEAEKGVAILRTNSRVKPKRCALRKVGAQISVV